MPERDQEAEQEHADQHGHRRGERRREVRADRAERLGDDELEAGLTRSRIRRGARRGRSCPSPSAITRLRILSTISRSWVTIRIVVPAVLMRCRSCMIPTDVSGSRLPVGSSQMRSGGWLTTARAIETRCCSPPESSSGREPALCASPTSASTSGTFVRIDAVDSPCTRSAYATFSKAVRSRSSLKSWKTQPTFRRRSGTFERLSRVRSRPPTMMRPVVGSSSFRSSRMIVDLPEPDGPDDEDELALLDHERDTVERDDVRLVDLADVLEDDHRRRGRLRRAVLGGDLRRLEERGSGISGWSEEVVHAPGESVRRGRDPRGRSGSGSLDCSRVLRRSCDTNGRRMPPPRAPCRARANAEQASPAPHATG